MLVVVILGAGAVLAYDTLRQVRAVQQELTELRQTVRTTPVLRFTDPDQYAALLSQVEDVEAQVEHVEARVALLRAFRWLPTAGPRVREARQLMALGKPFARSVRLTVQGLAAVPAALAERDPEMAFLRVRDAVAQGQPVLSRAEASLVEAREARKALTEPYVFASLTGPAVEEVDRFMPLLNLAHLLVRESPDLLAHAYILRLELGTLADQVTNVSEVLRRPGDLRDLLEKVSQHRQAAQDELLRLRPMVAQLEGLGQERDRLERVMDTQVQILVLLGHLEGVGRAFLDIAEVANQRGLLTEESGGVMGERLAQARDALEAAEGQLEYVQDLLAQEYGQGQSSLGDLGALLGALDVRLDRLGDALPAARQALELAWYALGFDAPRTLLLVAQNNDEIRATGGFIGVVAELTIQNGTLARIRYMDSTEVDSPPYSSNPAPPDAVYRYLWMAKLLFRDANWNPHFPASAVALADIYESSQGVRLDGVIAVTKEAALDMVEALGGVRVAELPGIVDRDTASRYIDGKLPYPCLPRHGPRRGKRCFDQDLFEGLLGQAQAPRPLSESSPVVQTLLSALEAKKALVHVFDPEAAGFLWHEGWNGAVRQVDHDYLMAVDSSMPGHAFSLIERSTEYRVALDPEQGLQAQVRLRYRHRGTEDDPVCRQAETTETGCYWDYLRLLIPGAARNIVVPPIPMHSGAEWLIWGYPDIDSARVTRGPDVGLGAITEIGGYLAVEPGTLVTIPVEYELPWDTVRQVGPGVYEYQLLVQKQPGIPPEQVAVMVALPPGARLVATSPSVTAQQGLWLRFDLTLTSDRTVRLTFSLP